MHENIQSVLANQTIVNYNKEITCLHQTGKKLKCFLTVLVGLEETVPLTQDWQDYKMTQLLNKI